MGYLGLREDDERWYVIPINPEPWEIGPAYFIRGQGGRIIPKIGPNKQLKAYKEAVQEALKPLVTEPPIEHEVELKFWFWRILEQYTQVMSGRKITTHKADGTNLMKATEDALQGIVIKNDRQVVSGTFAIMKQSLLASEEETGLIVVRVRHPQDHESEIPSAVWDNISDVAPLRDGVVESRDYIDPEDLF